MPALRAVENPHTTEGGPPQCGFPTEDGKYWFPLIDPSEVKPGGTEGPLDIGGKKNPC